MIAAESVIGNGASALAVFLALVLVVSLSLFATSRLFYRIQRNRVVAALVSGGWLAVAVGFLLGPNALAVIEADTLLEARPLLMVGLGWIGVIVGMQANRALLKNTPAVLWKWAAADLAASALLVGLLAVAVLLGHLPDDHRTFGWIALPVALLVACAVGWAPETRSLQGGRNAVQSRFDVLVKGGAGLTSIAAIALFGVCFKLVGRNADGMMRVMPGEAIIALVMAVVLAIFLGVAGRVLLDIAGRQRSQTLVVFVGMVALVTGAAAELLYSPLFAAMLAGAVVANLASARLREFESFLLRAEHAVAVLFYLLAGLLIQPTLGTWAWILIAAISALRLIVKPIVMRIVLKESREHLPAGPSLYTAPVRQSPVAVALAVGLVLSESSMLNRDLLTIVVLTALICDLLPISSALLTSRPTGAAAHTPARSEAGEAGRERRA